MLMAHKIQIFALITSPSKREGRTYFSVRDGPYKKQNLIILLSVFT